MELRNVALKYFWLFKIIDVLLMYKKVRWTCTWNIDKDDVNIAGFVFIPMCVADALRK